MPKSMTGFGRSSTSRDDWTHDFEIRSVNSRFLDLKWRLPLFLRGMEGEWEKIVREYATRGRVEIHLNLQVAKAELLGMALNEPMALSMIDQVRALAAQSGHSFTPDYNRLLGLSSLWQESVGEPDPRLMESLEQGLREALADWNRSRELEGETLRKDLMERLGRIRGFHETIKAHAPQITADKIEILRGRLKTAMEGLGVELPEDRMLQEIVILSDRIDISEELTRLASHLDLMEKTLAKGGEIGKKFDFLLQETFREINTCGNKAQNSGASKVVVDFKTELEKCREQIQNIE